MKGQNEESKNDVAGKAMAGRQFDKDGKDIGDADFHETGWGFSAEKEEATLAELSAHVIELEEQQVKGIAENDAKLGAAAYRQLLKRHPDSERADAWREEAARLDGKKD